MAKVLQIAAVVVAVAAAIPSGGTSLLGVGLAQAGVTTAAGVALSASTTAMIATAVGLASGAVTALTAKSPSVGGSQTDWQSDPNGAAPIVFGETLVAGSVIYRKTANRSWSGKKNYWQFIGTILSACGPIDAHLATWADKVVTTFVGDNAVGDLHGRVYQATQLGLCPEPSRLQPAGPWDNLAGLPSWTSASKLSGYAAAMNAFIFDGKGSTLFTQVPDMQHRIRGVKCYDPRQDDTYPGGSGAQRYNDQTTWAYSVNPWVQATTFALGWFQGPNNVRVGGVGMPIGSIDLASYVEAANVADANGWQSHGQLQTTDDKWEDLKALCQAGGGEPVRLGATLSCIVNTPRVSIGTITRDDVIGNASITTTQTRRDRINGIIPTYRSEDHDFEQVPAGAVRRDTYLAADKGVERTKAMTYSMIQCFKGKTPDQAAQIAGYDIANAREAGPIAMPLKLRWLGYRAGDCVTFEDTPEFGYMRAKKALVLKRQLDPDQGSVVLTLREETDSKHSWALGLVGTPAPITDRNAPADYEAPDPSDWTAVASVSSGGDGVITLTGAVNDDAAKFLLIEYREVGAAFWTQQGYLPTTTTTTAITGLDTSKTYEVAISYYSELRLVISNLSFDVPDVVPTASNVTVDTAANPPSVAWRMPDISGWSTAVIYRSNSSDPNASAAVSDELTGALFADMDWQDATLSPGTYWWWVRIYNSAGTLLSISSAASGTIT
ncbi:hypothetical protein [Novosphingobium sp. 9]|uniref:hypothetical protein n=1 Tax=Novosphingobium sp. 9 TaxID=2025349 RepID=UPI0021B5EB91|nr:hypothetical protein [Novosphingobium sp. 9]